MMIETLTLNEATEVLRRAGLRINNETLKAGLQQGVYPFGLVINLTERDGRHKDAVQIFTRLLTQWIDERMMA